MSTRPAKTLVPVPAPVFRWMPWMSEVVRLDSQGFGAAEIAPRLNRLSHEVAQLMETPEYKAQRLANQDRLRFLFEDRLLQLWGLSNEVILAAQETVASYREKLQEPVGCIFSGSVAKEKE